MHKQASFWRNFSWRGWLENFAFVFILVIFVFGVSRLIDTKENAGSIFTPAFFFKYAGFSLIVSLVKTIWGGSLSGYKRGD